MKTHPILLIVAAALVLPGCSSTPDHVDKGAISATTFSFINPGSRMLPDYADPRMAIHAKIQEAITASLAARGVRRVDTGGEVTVAYLIIRGNNASTSSIREYFGYGRDATELQQKAHTAYTQSKNPSYFEAGTLVVDFIEPRSFDLLWRGHITRPLLSDLPPDTQTTQLRAYVDELLKDLRLKSS